MKKFAFLFLTLLMVNVVVWASNDKPIQVSEMPKMAQQFIQQHFANQSVAVAKMETDFMSKSYDVIFTNGDKVEFDKKGKWTNVDCEHSQVPVAVIPTAIQNYIKQHYPEAKVLKIEKTDHKGYDVDLNNGFELEFDKRFKVVDIDR